jgi:hypothetical protein
MSIFLNPVKKLAGKIFGKGPVVDGQTRTARLSKCLTCPALIFKTKNCKYCLCFVEEKVKFQNEKCHLNRWQP